MEIRIKTFLILLYWHWLRCRHLSINITGNINVTGTLYLSKTPWWNSPRVHVGDSLTIRFQRIVSMRRAKLSGAVTTVRFNGYSLLLCNKVWVEADYTWQERSFLIKVTSFGVVLLSPLCYVKTAAPKVTLGEGKYASLFFTVGFIRKLIRADFSFLCTHLV